MFDSKDPGSRPNQMMNSFRGSRQGARGPRKRMVRHSSARGAPSDNSSRYINTEHKRDQISTRGGQANTLAYSLNKNMKNMKIGDKKTKTRPKTAGRARAGPAPRPQKSSN
jgi:hypothetical protein